MSNNIKSSELKANTLTNVNIKANLSKVKNDDLEKLIQNTKYKYVVQEYDVSQFYNEEDLFANPVLFKSFIQCITIELEDASTLFISNYFVAISVNNKFDNYNGTENYIEQIQKIVKELQRINSDIVINSIVMEKNNSIILLNKADIGNCIAKEYINPITEESTIISKKSEQIYSIEDVIGKLKMSIEEGVLEDNGTDVTGYQMNFNLKFGIEYHNAIGFENLNEDFKKINSEIFRVYTSVFTMEFLNYLKSLERQNILVIRK